MRPFVENWPYMSNRGAFALQEPDGNDRDALVLAAGTQERIAIPAGAAYVAFAPTDNSDFWVKFGDATVAAAVPSTDVTNRTASDLNPAMYRLSGTATHVSVVSPVACTVSLKWFS